MQLLIKLDFNLYVNIIMIRNESLHWRIIIGLSWTIEIKLFNSSDQIKIVDLKAI